MEKHGKRATDVNILRRRKNSITQTHTQNMSHLLFSHCHNGHTNAPEGYVIRTLHVLVLFEPRVACLLSLHIDSDPALNWWWGLLVVWTGVDSVLVWSGATSVEKEATSIISHTEDCICNV